MALQECNTKPPSEIRRLEKSREYRKRAERPPVAGSGNREKSAMSIVPQPAPSDAEQLPKDILELVGAISALPPQWRAVVEPMMAQVVESTRRRRRILALVQEALSQLRLDMKYLMFDLEATRRERDAYRQKNQEE
jgi:hypothetical protein